MFRVGLTGGIASGKTTISRFFEQLDIPVIDADIISHQLMEPGQQGYTQTVEHFGLSILNSDKTINRELLRKHIFNDSKEKSWLEQMLHPLIRDTATQLMLDQSDAEYVLLVVPLMFETGFNQLVDHVIAIDCSLAIQRERLIQRELIKTQSNKAIDETIVDKMIASQLSNKKRISLSNSVLKNDDNQCREQSVKEIHKHLLTLAQKKQK